MSDSGGRTEFSGRGLTSVLTTLSFVLLAISGLVLFVTPPGRVAHWTGWRLFGLTKTQWGSLHIWFSAIFLVSSAFHVYFNWRTLLSYFKNRLTRRFSLRLDWVAAVVICAVAWGGTLAEIPPFSTLVAFNERVKNSWENTEERAPVPHAELLTLAELADKGGTELPLIMTNLENAGITNATEESVVGDLAAANGMTPVALYDLALGIVRNSRGSGGRGSGQGQGQGHGGGMGQKTLEQVCGELDLDLEQMIATLKSSGIDAKADMILRDIAYQNGMRPPDLMDILHGRAK